jgi:hypothetical protein
MASVPTKKDSTLKNEKTTEQLQADGATIGSVPGFVPGKKITASYDPGIVITQPVASFGQIKVEIVAVEVPYVDTEADKSDYSTQCNRCDLGRLTKEQARKLRAIRRGYDYSQARLANGGEIKSLADAVRALIDSVDI